MKFYEAKRYRRNSDGMTPIGAPNAAGVCKNYVFRPIEKSLAQIPYCWNYVSIRHSGPRPRQCAGEEIHGVINSTTTLVDYGPVPALAWSFLELGSAPLAIDNFVWLSHKYGTVFLPTSLHQFLYRLSRDNLKLFYLPNLSHHFKWLSHICVPCPRSYFT